MKSIKTLWARFGYYIVLFAFVALIGASAYAIKSGSLKKQPEPAREPIRAASSLDEPMANKSGSAKLIWPLPSETVITPNSPDEPIWSQDLQMYHTHEGIDISAVLGEAVRACMRGSVVSIYNDEMLGNTVELKHEGGIRTVYAGLSTLNLVKLGQTVRQGEIIGAVGEGSRLEAGLGPHLHFEAYENGVWLDLPESE